MSSNPTMNFASIILVALLAIVATPQHRQPDVGGGVDYPLFANRMPGYRISAYKKEGFRSHQFNTAPKQTIEGRYIRIDYTLDSGENPGDLAIIRNHQNAAKSAGAQILPCGWSGCTVIKATRDGVEVWIELEVTGYGGYYMTVIECAPMRQVIRAKGTAAPDNAEIPQEPRPKTQPDVGGSADYPLFSNRMPGYRISAYEKEGFRSHQFSTEPRQTIEGRYLRIDYDLDSGENPGDLAIIRNYQNAAKSAGAQILPCRWSGCSVFKATRDGVEVWIEVEVTGYGGYYMTVIECAPMRQVIRAEAMAAALDKDGFVALDILFATDKAEILPESRPIIDEIVSLLKIRINLRIGVEGHTDSTGNTATNKTLSNARAKAVVEAIVAAGININRLEPVGYGQERPIADNRTEEGRAKNRRVELVKR
jgi:OmpA-OmpF porin, OOP family